jgi:hypothetical protein
MQISRVCAPDAPLAVSRAIPAADGTTLTYHYQPVSDDPVSDQMGFNLVPLVLAKDGSLWEPAVAYVMDRIQGQRFPNMTTLEGIADDLGFFLEFLEDRNVDFTNFLENKLKRPTYLFHGYLKQRIHAGEMAASTAKRRKATLT